MLLSLFSSPLILNSLHKVQAIIHDCMGHSFRLCPPIPRRIWIWLELDNNSMLKIWSFTSREIGLIFSKVRINWPRTAVGLIWGSPSIHSSIIKSPINFDQQIIYNAKNTQGAFNAPFLWVQHIFLCAHAPQEMCMWTHINDIWKELSLKIHRWTVIVCIPCTFLCVMHVEANYTEFVN